ncbi:MAG: hydroxyethylthiazole kinase [Clostridia bacterium]|nr:hydroxyethylthiazole kinase [Clostridia bacterium]
MINKICNIREGVLKQQPLIHCITNPISINQCANAILSLGAKPIMAEHPEEVCEITDTADALMLNIGNITDARMKSMMLALQCAKNKGIPVLLDAVGIACSGFRRTYVLNLLNTSVPFVIKGNYSEIMALYHAEYVSSGVDADDSVDVCHITQTATELSRKYQTVILATGQTDVITDGKRMVHVQNGTPELASVTGTGCMLGAVCSAFMTSARPMEGAIAACVYLGICGELAKTEKGNGSFMVNLMDKISILDKETIAKHMKMEEK